MSSVTQREERRFQSASRDSVPVPYQGSDELDFVLPLRTAHDELRTDDCRPLFADSILCVCSVYFDRALLSDSLAHFGG